MSWRERLLSIEEASAAIPDEHTRAAVAIALRGEEVLLMQRAERPGDRWSGQISLPGGHAEAVDAHLAATAIRETREEVGVDLTSAGKLLGALAPIQAKVRGVGIETTILPAVFAVDASADPTFELGPEASDAFWFPLDRAERGDFDAEYRYEGRGVVMQLPSWEYESYTVWGLTYAILRGLLD
ncbi:MAG: CoA pyrophosphatase [Planctomycetota bacterium]|nr:CoA pyrophosphatase [Planctomycetota bacterium]